MESTIEQALQQGVAAHKEGKLQEAERLYRVILQSQPLHPDANHNLGVLAVSVNKVDVALPLFKTALDSNPKIEQFWLSYIDALIKEKRFENAKEVLEQGKKQGVTGEKLDALESQLSSETENKKVNPVNPSQQQLNSLLEYYQTGRYGDAEKLALSNTQQFPKHQFSWKVLGAVLKQNGRIRESLVASQKSLQLSSQDAEAHSNLGVTLQELGRLDEAEASLRQAIALKPDYAEAHYNLGITLQELGRLDEAESSLRQAISLKPDYVEAYYRLGITLQELSRLEEAEASYKQAVALKLDYAEVHYNLGLTLQKLSRLDEAETSYTQAIALKPEFSEAHYNLGVTLQELGRLNEAETSYTQVIALKPDYAEAHYNLGITLQELGRLDEAKTSYTKAIALKSDYAEAHRNLGNTLQELGSLEEAEASYNHAISLKPEFVEAHNNLGNTLKELGRLDEAEASYRQAIELKFDFVEAHNNLGVTLRELNRLDESEASYTQAIALNPDYADAHSNFGNTLQELGRLDEAEASYKQAIALKPDFAEAHSNLAVTLIEAGLRESALEHFQRSLQLERGLKPINMRHKSFINISKAKIDHDIDQFEYLIASGYDIKKFHDLVAIYKTVSAEINCISDTDIVPLSDKHKCLLGDTYNRPIHILEAPLLDEPAINKNLNINKITDDYFSHEFGLTYIDDLLSPMTLASLRRFLLGSTIWFDFFHNGGYMGAYLKDGLASPLILQIAEDLRKKLPKIFKHHKLNQLWAYKYDSRARNENSFTGINAHADFAAVNVNFWITPKSANLDPSSGGLVVYDAEAPLEWDFRTYNNNEEKIRKEILKSNQKKTIIPYNENRAVIFNSNLFHETDNIDFKDGYENRRINVTMLFGKRES